MAAACAYLRTDVELPDALRYLTRLVRDVRSALQSIKGLFPQCFSCEPTLCEFADELSTVNALMGWRDIASRYLPELPTPLGFNPHSNNVHSDKTHDQHRVGRDPPVAFVDAA